MFVRSIFYSLPLILTLLAASICHFLIPEFFFFFFFWCCCCCCFFFRFSSFSVIGVSVVVVEGNGPTHGHVITKFSRIYSLPFFLSYARELR